MEQIRLGLEQGLDVSLYADEDYNWSQMEEIRLGLEDNLNVSEYIDSELEPFEMQEIRLKLKKEKQKNNLNLKKSEVVSFEDDINKKTSFLEKSKNLISDLKKGLG